MEHYLTVAAEPGYRPTEADSGDVETQVEQRRRRTRATFMAWKLNVEPLARGTEVSVDGGSADQSNAGGSEDQGGAGGKEEPGEPESWKELDRTVEPRSWMTTAEILDWADLAKWTTPANRAGLSGMQELVDLAETSEDERLKTELDHLNSWTGL